MAIYIGIDGGGSNLRVAAVDESLNVIAQVTRGAANPSGIGREASAALIQDAMREVMSLIPDQQPPPQPLSKANLFAREGGSAVPTGIQAVGIGVAGASPVYADDWLREVVGAVLPGVLVATATDVEMALVGANGERKGIIVVAGTGSVAFGVNEAGESLQVGGWGYLLGDKGSGYAIGQEALRLITVTADQLIAGDELNELTDRVLKQLGFKYPKEIIPWIYRQPTPVSEIAAIAPLILQMAEEEHSSSKWIVREAARFHQLMVTKVIGMLFFPQTPRIAFGGGLLTSENILSRQLVEKLELPGFPEPKYPPVIGAALLAKIKYGQPE